MNENKSLKLHKSHKIVCFIVCFVIVFATLTISAFADEGVFNLTGTYNFRTPPSNMSGSVYSNGGTIIFSSFNATFFDGDGGTFGGSVRFVGVNSLQVSPNTITLYRSVDNSTSPFTIEVIGDGNSVTYDCLSCNFSNDGNSVTLSIDGGTVTTAFTGEPSTMTFNGSFTTGGIDTDYFIDYFGRIDEYDGNPWSDILNGVLEALDVNIFGTFSYLDIVSTLAGACLTIWLLKMLAGG